MNLNKDWQNETVSDEEERFWIPLIDAETHHKNTDFPDKDRVRVEKWRMKKGKRRIEQLDKVLKIDRKEVSRDLKELGFSSQHALHYIGTLGPEDSNTITTILGVVWHKALPPRTKKEEAEFNRFSKVLRLLIDEFKEQPRKS